ncbi:MAG: chitobiase/beta-hexosaminidase C-terminal domain-containing protein [Bacteroidales bacterium]|nr:chitobiase/beta-hexosaminidase C-terminal domain-containing protein [Bacteroidales bacterium]
MKRKFSILFAALAAILLITPPHFITKAQGQTFEKITSEPADWSGEYLLVYENSSTEAYVWTGVDDSNCYVTAPINNDQINASNLTGHVTLTIAPMTKGYSIKVNGSEHDGKYISGKSGSNTIFFGTTEVLNTLTYSESEVLITSNTSVMRFNKTSGQMRFRYFKSTSYTNQQSVQLYKKVEGGGGGTIETVSTPSITPNGGTFFNTQEVTITCATDGATIYYTLDGTEPTNAGSIYSKPLTITSTTTVKAKAYKEGFTESDVASAEFTIVTPLTDMQQIFEGAEETSKQVYITFNNWIISHTSTKQAFLTDGEEGCIIYNNNGHNFNTNDVLSGTVLCEIIKYHGAAEIVGLKNQAEGLTVTQNGNIDPVVKTIGELEAINTGQKVKFEYLTYNKDENNNETLTDGTNTISIITNSTLKNGKQYDVTGVFCFDNTGNNKIYSQEEIEKAYIDYSEFNNLTQFSYVLGNGPSEAQQILLLGENIEGGLTISVSDNFELRLGEEGEYSNTISIPGTEFLDNLYIRLKGDLEIGEYQGTLSFTANNLQTKEIGLTGVVAESEIYNIIIGTHENGEISANNPTSKAGETITLTNTPNKFYQFISWNVVDNNSNPIEVVDNKFIMPESDVMVNAVFERIQYQITFSVNGNTESIAPRNYNAGEAATLPTEDDITVPEGFNFVGWTKNEETAELIPQQFIPTENTNLYLVFGNTYYEKVKELNDITAGTYIIVSAINYCLPNLTTSKSPIVDEDYLVENASSTDRYYSVPDNTEWTFTGTNTAMYITNSEGKYLYATSNSDGLRVNTTQDTWAFEIKETGFAMKEAKNSRYCGIYNTKDWRSYAQSALNNYADGGVLYLFKKSESLITRVYDASTTTQMENIPSTAIVTVPNGVVFTLTGTNKGSANNLIIEDGGQLIVNNRGVKATFKKSIEATPTAKTTEGGWYSIASPVNNVAISSVTNLVDNAAGTLYYNLYRYDEQSSVWQAYNTTEHPGFTTLDNGQGYLYRNNGMELSFSGEVNQGDVRIALTNSATNNELKGFNLIGNPFGHNIYKGSGAAIDNNNLSEGFYYLTNHGAWQAGDGSKAITPQMGVLVQVTGEASEVTLTISDKNNSPTNTRYANDNLQFIVSNNEYQDVAYAKFSKGHGLNKISHRNSEVPMLYIPQNGERYAIAMMSDNTEMFALNFKAATMGRYTLNYKAEGEFSYLHVIDRLTGDDVDMLLEGEYSFTASPKDNESRFIVRLAYKPDYSNEGNEVFVYQNGDEILVSGEGELQVFDATGRLVRNMSINGAKSLNISTQGMYIFRLVGNEVKTQKIVVR